MRLITAIITATAAVALLLGSPALAQLTYNPPPTHYCVDIGQPPGLIDLTVLPTSQFDRDWVELRYLTHEGKRNPGAWRGTGDLHTPEWEADLKELGYNHDFVAVRDAYCAQDTELQQRARAQRFSLEVVTPFQPGFQIRGARNWNTEQWWAFLTYNKRALQLIHGPDYTLYVAVVERQLKLIESGDPIAAESPQGGWKLNKAGKWVPTSWRWGNPNPAWVRPVRIELPPRELGFSYDVSRLSTGVLSTDLVGGGR